jgi:hypothetical protein
MRALFWFTLVIPFAVACGDKQTDDTSDEFGSHSDADSDGSEAAPGDECADGGVYDCALECWIADARSYIGDGTCDDGSRGPNFDCESFSSDMGDCSADADVDGGDTGADADVDGSTDTDGSTDDTGGSTGDTGESTDDTGSVTPPCTSYTMDTLEADAFLPSVVRLAVKLRCDGAPVTDKTEEDFSITEDGLEVSAFESDLSLVPTVAAFRLVNAMVLDMSGSIVDSGYLDDLQTAAQTFVERLGEDQEVAIYLFDGREGIQTLIGFTSDHGALSTAIGSLDDYEVVDPSTNLNGAVIAGLSVLDAVAASGSGGTIEASMVIFTDGADMAGRVSNEAAELAVSLSPHNVYAVGLGSALDEAHMTALGTDGYYVASDIESLEAAFDDVATLIRDEASSIYILAYCSPKRAGLHTLELRLTGTSASTTFDFNASGFVADCDPEDFVHSGTDDGGSSDDGDSDADADADGGPADGPADDTGEDHPVGPPTPI